MKKIFSVTFVTGRFLLLSSLLLCKTALAQTLLIQNGDSQLSATAYVTLLEDPEHALTIEQIVTPAYKDQFKPHPSDYPDLGYNKSVWWLKLDIERQTLQSWYILIDFVALSRVDAFLIPADSNNIVHLGDMRQEFSFQRLPMMRLPEETDRFTLYLRVNNHGKERIWLPIQLISADALTTKTAKDVLFYGGIILGLLLLIPYNLCLYLSLRNAAYLSLVIFLVCLILVLQRTNNVIPWLSPFSNPATFYYHLSFQLVTLSAVQFWRQATDSKQLLPRPDKVIRIGMLLLIIHIPFSMILPHSESWVYTMNAVIILTVGCLGSLALYKKSRIIPSFSLPMFLFILSVTPAVLWGMGFIPQFDITNRVLNIGSLFSVIFLSVTLAEHTRQLRLQAELSKTESEAKDNFLTTMSHELRTPMHAVNSAVYLFKSTPLSDQQKTYLETLEISASHIMDLINKILDLGRMGSDEFSLEKNPFELDKMLQEIGQLLTEEAKNKQLSLYIRNQTSLAGKLLTGDTMRLKQVLLNLLHNAIKFTDKGSVTLIIEDIPGTHLPENTVALKFRVIDTGIGIPEQQQQSVFHPFSQADNSTRRRYGGSGLGLAISHKLVNQMGGTLKLNSKPGAGSCFFFSLEFLLHTDSTESATACTTLPEIKRRQNKVKALLVDDVELNRFSGSELLKMLGVDVITAESAEVALQTLKSSGHTIDLVFMDVSMPEMDGYEATRQIRSEAHFDNLPIIALTAHAIEGERERCLNAGMDDYLTKPFGLEQLQEKINRWTQHLA